MIIQQIGTGVVKLDIGTVVWPLWDSYILSIESQSRKGEHTPSWIYYLSKRYLLDSSKVLK